MNDFWDFFDIDFENISPEIQKEVDKLEEDFWSSKVPEGLGIPEWITTGKEK